MDSNQKKYISPWTLSHLAFLAKNQKFNNHTINRLKNLQKVNTQDTTEPEIRLLKSLKL